MAYSHIICLLLVLTVLLVDECAAFSLVSWFMKSKSSTPSSDMPLKPPTKSPTKSHNTKSSTKSYNTKSPTMSHTKYPVKTTTNWPPSSPRGVPPSHSPNALPTSLGGAIAPPRIPPHVHHCMSIIQNESKHKYIWMHARRVAKRKYPLPLNTTFTPTMFLSQNHDVRVFNISNTPMQYRINWKGGSSNVVANLFDIQQKTGSYLPEYRAVQADTNHEARLISKGFGFSTLHAIKSFTYVRDPMSHFLAGLREYYYRLYRDKFVLTPQFLEQDLYDMLDTNMTFLPSTLHSVMHIFPQAGILSFNANPSFVTYPYNLPTYVGKLEKFDEDWQAINKMYGVNITLQTGIAVHPTQQDPNKVKDAFDILMKENKSLRNALCVLLHIDYLCFDYEIPQYCRDIVKKVF